MKSNFSNLFLMLLPFFLINCTQTTPEQKYGLLLEKYIVYWNTGEFQDTENVLHQEFEIRMTPKYEPEKGIALFKENVTKWRRAYPDFHIRVIERFFTEKEAAVLWEITATNNGEGLHPPTGKSVKVTGMSIFHFSEDKIRDEWIASNNSYWMQQLGFKFVSPFEVEN